MSTQAKTKRPSPELEGMANDIMATLGVLTPILIAQSLKGDIQTGGAHAAILAQEWRFTNTRNEAGARLTRAFLGGYTEYLRLVKSVGINELIAPPPAL